MTSPRRGLSRVAFIAAAADDMRALAQRHPEVAREAFRQLVLLDRGDVTPARLRRFGKTGDLTDCGKIIVAVDGYPEYRIVVRDIDGTFRVTEVIAVDARSHDLPYLLAGIRLGRLDDPVRRSDTQRRIARIRRLLEESD